jgi:hypothetical protein
MRRRTDPASELTALAMLLAVDVRHRSEQLGMAKGDWQAARATAADILTEIGMPSLAEPLSRLRRRVAARHRAKNGKPAATGTDFT